MKNRLKLLVFLVVGLFLITFSQSFSQEETFKPKSESKALAFSVFGTFLPVYAGGLFWALDDPDYASRFNPITLQFERYQKNPDHTWPLVLIISGPVVGPSMGYLYGAPSLGNLKGLLIRSVAVGAVVWIWQIEKSNDSYNPSGMSLTAVKSESHTFSFIAGVIATGVVLISAGNDMAKVRNAVRKHNRNLLFKNSWNITPKYFAESQTLGLGIEMKF